ncbi:MAG TPA: tetratricopeptide repeat protein [Sphingomicrobium sp.]
MLQLLLAAGVAAGSPPSDRLAEAEHAISAGRLVQARAMISAAVASGAKGEPVERLLAHLAYASGNSGEALARYKVLVGLHPTDALIVERAGISAIKVGEVQLAKGLIDHATSLPGASWRSWNARGVIADLQRDFETADSSYQRALALAPGQAEILSNLGWSRLLRGDWNGALAPLQEAAKLAPNSVRTRNNLELARAAVAADLPQRRPGESEDSWAIRLNDAGMVAELRGDKARAVAAFAQAIEARGSWYERAANNLQAAGAKE